MFLNCHTYFSLRYGTLSPKELLQHLQKEKIAQFALTDINTTSACLDVMRLASKYNVKPSLGIDFRNGAQRQFIMLAQDNQGFLSINKYLSSFLHSKETIPATAKNFPEPM